MIQSWRLDDTRQTLVLSSQDDRLPEVVYWGARLPDDEDLLTLYHAQAIDFSGGMLDHNPPLSICPEASQTFPGQPGLSLSDSSGRPMLPKFRLIGASQNADHLQLAYRDSALSLTYRAEFLIDRATHMIVSRASVECERPVQLHWLSAPVFPGSQFSVEMIDFTGRWCGEFQSTRTSWSAGVRLRENRTGRTGHEHFPGLIVPNYGATNTQGHAYGFHYGWSGGHRMVAEELPDGRRQIQFGNASFIELSPGRLFETAPLYATFSDRGINGCGTAFQRHLRDRIVTFPDKTRSRPVHYNCWEAVYFDHNLNELKEMAELAAHLGAERFVLDDGWFGQRNDDTSSLADWEIDKRKFPDGLAPLVDHVHKLGMTFGIWFEPEMVNPDSNVYRANPEWVLGDADQILGRNQLVLDMSLEDVQDYLFDCIEAVLSKNAIDYVKWDHNRVLPFPDASQTRGFYRLLDRVREAFPKTEIESCAAGGGRIDFGVLERAHRVWLSDSNDALERMRMQHESAVFLPMAVTGSHVGPRKCHTSGRVLDIRIRAWVAAQRHMGFELDPRELTEEEAKVLRNVTSWWKSNRDWRQSADILRLDSPDPTIIAEQQLEQNGERFVLFVGNLANSAQISPRPLRLTELAPNALYKVELINRHDADTQSRGRTALKHGPLELRGSFLMNHGIVLPCSNPQSMWVLEGTRL